MTRPVRFVATGSHCSANDPGLQSDADTRGVIWIGFLILLQHPLLGGFACVHQCTCNVFDELIMAALECGYTMILFILVVSGYRMFHNLTVLEFTTDSQPAWNPVISALLVYDQVTGAEQVIKNSLVRQRPICGQIDIAQHDLLAGFEHA